MLFGEFRATRNPYNKNRISGGSSGGSAAAVSAGLCPVALGVDGGGNSIMYHTILDKFKSSKRLISLHICRIGAIACCSLWCCWFETNIWPSTSFRVTIVQKNELEVSYKLLYCICKYLTGYSCCWCSVLPLNWTVGMVGVLAGTVEDALLVFVLFSF